MPLVGPWRSREHRRRERRFEEGPGNTLANSGAVYVFVRNGSTWTQQAYLRAPNADAQDFFGTSVALSGDVLAVGATGEDASANSKDPLNNDVLSSGAVYTYKRTGSTWTHQRRIKAPNATRSTSSAERWRFQRVPFHRAANEANSTASLSTDNNNAMGAGAVYVYSPDSVGWNLHSYLKASTTDTSDFFGDALAVSGDTLVVGATNDANSVAASSSPTTGPPGANKPSSWDRTPCSTISLEPASPFPATPSWWERPRRTPVSTG